MVSNALTLLYIVMCFAGLQSVVFILIVLKHNENGNTKLFKATRNFMMASFFVGAYYFFTYYRELVLGEFQAPVIMRALDSVQFYVMGLTWVQMIDAVGQSDDPRLTPWRKSLKPVFAGLMLLSAVTYVFLLDGMYTARFPAANVIAVAGEVILGAVVIIYTAVFTRRSRFLDSRSRKYIVVIDVLVNFNNIWNNIIVVAVFLKQMQLTLLCSKLYGVTAVALLAINLYSLIYIYKTDFSPLYSSGGDFSESGPDSRDHLLDMVAEEHRLTEREREVMILAYQGLTNPDIAERLFISKYTVKRHMHNVFEKLDVSSRVELVHLISSKTV